MQYFTQLGPLSGPIVPLTHCHNDTVCLEESGFGACCMKIYLTESPSRPSNQQAKAMVLHKEKGYPTWKADTQWLCHSREELIDIEAHRDPKDATVY